MRRGGAIYDLAICGGGINGCGIARDAAGRGLSVILVEKGDLAGATSSASTKLIHGGLRYLEHREFRLVRESLKEREVLWAMAPHIIWPLRFVLPHDQGLRPAWMIRAGLFLYDHLGGRDRLPASRSLDLSGDAAGRPLRPRFRAGFEYSDCWVEDARLVVLNAMSAQEAGAAIRTRVALAAAERQGDLWHLRLVGADGVPEEARARALINASGPWVSEVTRSRLGQASEARVRLVKGSHIVVPRLFEHDRCYIFQNADGRIVFAIPYERDFTLIGTTDVDYEGDPSGVCATDGEIAYLAAAASEYFERPVRPVDVVWTYSGVRPLYDDGARNAQAATRDYVLKLEDHDGKAPLLNIYGGKITTYRRLAEAALDRLKPYFVGMTGAWTRGATLPGGDFSVDGFADEVAALTRLHPPVGPDHARRLVRAYGTRWRRLAEGVGRAEDWGRVFAHDLTEREVIYLMDEEWALRAEDVLWRRSKLGLRVSGAEAAEIDAFMAGRGGAVAPLLAGAAE